MWYLLKLNCDATTWQLGPFVCASGKYKKETIKIYNPSNEKEIATISLDNDRDFQVISGATQFPLKLNRQQANCNSVAIPPKNFMQFEIIFWAAQTGNREGVLSINGLNIGNNIYILKVDNLLLKIQGVSTAPELMEPANFLSKVSETRTNSVTFTNPFHQKISVQISISPANDFMILTENTSFEIGSLESVEIPIAFMPKVSGIR